MRPHNIMLLLSVITLISCNNPSKKDNSITPTSDIPERREFPINLDVNPCENFYDYACSRVQASFKLRDDRSKHTFAFSDSAERLLEAKKTFLANIEKEKKLTPRGEQLKNVYAACMNENAKKNEEQQEVKKYVDDLKNIKSHKDFIKLNGDRLLSTEYSVFGFGGIANQDNPDYEDLYFLADVQSLPERSYYSNKELRKDYLKVVEKFFTTIGYDQAKKRAERVLDFETEFSKTYPLPEEFREILSTKNLIDRKSIKSKYSNFPLESLLSKIPNRVSIRHLAPQNFEWLNRMLVEANLETLKDVYVFHALKDIMDDAYPEYYQMAFDFAHKHLGGPLKRPMREERCTRYIMSNFTKEIDAELLPKIFPDFPTKKFVSLAEKIRASIINGLKQNQWLSAEGKKRAINKIRTASLQLVKPMNNEEWDFNPPAKYSKEKPIYNAKLLQTNLLKKELKEIATKRNRNKWLMGPLTVNAYYMPPDNRFVMPIGILQYPFYDPALSDEANLGAVGMVIAHELGHGIDDKGSRYDEKGRLNQWMSDQDLKIFKERGEKLVQQFNKAGFNGVLTLGENVADLVGMTFAYNAAFPNNKGTVEKKREFFIQNARVWCEVVRPKTRELLIKTDSHAAGIARVNEQVKHQRGFSEAFACKPNDPLNLPNEERIQIW